MINSMYDEKKAAQATELFIRMNGGEMNLLKLVKLLYAAERECLARWLRPLTYDKLVSMPRGQVVSYTYDRVKNDQYASGIWNKCFRTTGPRKERTVHLVDSCNINVLSNAELRLIEEIYQENKNKTPEDLEVEHHDSTKTPEWIDPHNSSLVTDYRSLLTKLGKTPDEIQAFYDDLKEAAFINSIRC